MKVYHICSYFKDKFYHSLMDEEMLAGIDLKLFFFAAKNQKNIDFSDIPYVRQAYCYHTLDRVLYYPKQEKAYKAFYKLFQAEPCDLIHAHSLFSNGYVAWRASKAFQVPYIVAVRDSDLNTFFKKMTHLRKLGIQILKDASRVCFLSEGYRRQLLEQYIPENLKEEIFKKSFILPNGISKTFLNNLGSEKHYKKTTELNLVTVGLIYKRKNQLLVCQACEELIRRGYQVRYSVIGKKYDSEYARRVIAYPFVQYYEPMPQEKLIDIYRKADIFVMPSITETFGLTYAESMSQGLPIIYSKNQGFDGQCPDESVGYAVHSSSVDEVAQAVIDIINNYETLSSNAIREVKRFDWTLIAREYQRIYQSCIPVNMIK